MRTAIGRCLLLACVLALSGLCSGCQENSAVKSSGPVESLRAGSQAPDFSLPLISGESVSLSDYNGKVVMLNFWATWCVPCVMEMPALERLAQSFSDKGLVVLGINLDNPSRRKEVEQFVRNYALSFPIALDSSFTVPRRYGVTGFPETFFIDREGRLLEVPDPLKNQSSVRFISDRPWDSPVYTEVISELLTRQ